MWKAFGEREKLFAGKTFSFFSRNIKPDNFFMFGIMWNKVLPQGAQRKRRKWD